MDIVFIEGRNAIFNYCRIFKKMERFTETSFSLLYYCKNGRIPGAEYKGNMWLIPEDAIKPEDPRKKNKVIDNGI